MGGQYSAKSLFRSPSCKPLRAGMTKSAWRGITGGYWDFVFTNLISTMAINIGTWCFCDVATKA